MKTMTRLSTGLCLFMLLSTSIVFAQNNTNLFSKADYPKPITASPEAAALGKYGEVPVSLFSGLPDISIPIYEFISGDIKVPIKLSYSAGGIRVDDIATNVGLGWSLNAGGLISRTEHGGPDGTNNIPFPANSFDPHSTDYELGKILVEEHKDLERDIYYYNFLNVSGKFEVNKNGKACFFPSNPNIKVEIQENGTPIIITDDHGVKYYFTLVESVKNTPVCSVGVPGAGEYPDETITAYYLTKIVSPNHSEVNFEYESYTYKVIKSYSEVRYEKQGVLDCPELSMQNRTCNTIQQIFGLRLKKIKSSDNSRSVEFSYAATNRLDLRYNNIDQGNYLDHIYIKQQAVAIKTWDLNYNYFGTGANLRLKLLSVKEDSKPPYEFSYNEQFPMPERLSFSQDYWGFYNGKTALNTFIPPIPAIGRITGADRTPDFDYMQSYSLNSIKYPTGDRTDFEYSAHQDNVTESVTNYVTESSSLSNTSNGSVDFLLPANAAEFRMSWNLTPGSGDDFMNGYIFGGPSLTAVYKTVSGDGFETNFPTLSTGATYRLAIASSNGNDLGNIYFEWKKPVTTTSTYAKIVFGGLRIKSIKTYNETQLTNSKFYSYNWINDPLQSSVILPGSAYDFLVFNSIYTVPKVNTAGNGSIILEGTCGYNVLSSSSAQSLGAALDNTIGYAQVVETEDLNAANGRTIYRYVTGGIEGAKGSLLEKTVQKLEDGVYRNVQKQKNSYQVPLNGQDTIPSMKISYIQSELVVGTGEHLTKLPAQFEVQKTLAISARWNLQESREISYSKLPTDSLESVTTYQYNSPYHTYPTIEDHTDSRGKAFRTSKTYIPDLNGSFPAIYTLMGTANIIAPVLTENKFNQNDNLQISFKKVNYADFGNGIFQPASVETAYGGASLNTEIAYNQYDVFGNLLTYRILNGITNGIHYGYNNQYAIAECKNASAEEFYHENFEETILAGTVQGTSAVPANTGKQYLTGNFTVSWVIPNSRTYVIRYAYRAGGIWKLSDVLPYSLGGFALTGGDAYDDVSVYPADAFMTTCTYSPLIGLTSSTDPKGITTYYEYDAFQRLKTVKDQHQQILKTNTYHYKN